MCISVETKRNPVDRLGMVARRTVVGGRGNGERRRRRVRWGCGEGARVEGESSRVREESEGGRGRSRAMGPARRGQAGGGAARLGHAWHVAAPTGSSLKKLAGASGPGLSGGLDQQELGQVDWTGKLQVRLLCFIFLLCFLLFNILPLLKIQNNFKIVTKPFE